MALLNYVVENIFRQPPIFLGLIALAGTLLQKKDLSSVIVGTLKTVIGVIVLMKGVDIIVASIGPISQAFAATFAAEGVLSIDPAAGFGAFLGNHGSTIGLVMVLAFALNLVVARLTPLKNIFLTGHIFFWMAFLAVATGVEGGLSGTGLVTFATIMLTLYIVITPALIRPFVKRVVGDDSFTIGHTAVGLGILGGWIGKLLGNRNPEETSTENLKIPAWMEFVRDTMVTTGIVMFLFYVFLGLAIGQEGRDAHFGGGDLFSYPLIQGMTFAGGLTVLLTGVRMMLNEIIPAFHGISTKLIPNSVPALDIPMVFPYAPNALLIGFLVSIVTSTVTLVLISMTGLLTYSLVPLTVACFFDVAPAAIFGNSTGGRRGAILASAIGGVVMMVLAAVSMPFLVNTGADFLQAFGGNDFSVFTIVSGWIAGLF